MLLGPGGTKVFGLLGKSLFRARSFGVDLYALYVSTRDGRTPWYARVLGLLVMAYLVSPIDLVPIAVPFFGLVDDLIIVPLGLKVVSSLVPEHVRAEAQARAARSAVAHPRFWRWVGVGLFVLLLFWLAVMLVLTYLIVSWLM
jgi:uncharacterized membrane protein YkvA (DUF1232 family)